MALSKAKGTILPISIRLLLQDKNRFCYIKSSLVSPLQMFTCVLSWGMCRGVPVLSFCSSVTQLSVLRSKPAPHEPTRQLFGQCLPALSHVTQVPVASPRTGLSWGSPSRWAVGQRRKGNSQDLQEDRVPHSFVSHPTSSPFFGLSIATKAKRASNPILVMLATTPAKPWLGNGPKSVPCSPLPGSSQFVEQAAPASPFLGSSHWYLTVGSVLLCLHCP